MEIVIIEKKTFEQMIGSFEDFAGQVKSLCENEHSSEKWLENNTVCKLLRISKRTLQSFRDSGAISFSQIGHKCFYKASDVELFIQQQSNSVRRNEV